jgi:hypothetical protein
LAEAGRAALALAEGERQAIADHRERWRRDRVRARQAAEEAEYDEIGQARRQTTGLGSSSRCSCAPSG